MKLLPLLVAFSAILTMGQAHAISTHIDTEELRLPFLPKMALSNYLMVQEGLYSELVYDEYGRRLSLLTWPVHRAQTANVELNIKATERLSLIARGGLLMDSKDGVVEDLDWEHGHILVAYSQATAELKDLKEFEIEGQFKVVHLDDVGPFLRYLIPSAQSSLEGSLLFGLQGKELSWHYKGGEQYTNYSGVTMDPTLDMYDHFNSDEIGIIYKYVGRTPYLGAQLDFDTAYFTLSGFAKVGFSTKHVDEDIHLYRGLLFVDTVRNAKTLEYGMSLNQSLSKHLTVTGRYKFTRVYTTRGTGDIYEGAKVHRNLIFTDPDGIGISSINRSFMLGIDYQF